MLIAQFLAIGILLGQGATVPKPSLFVHYMPWFQSKPYRGQWGWHWTMGKTDPDVLRGGLPDIASHYHPLLGAYDSADPDLIECHVQLMKLAGIDGVFVDWYGNKDLYDYGDNHRAATKFIEVLGRAGLRFSIVYEDRTVPNLLQKGVIPPGQAIAAGQTLFKWLESNWISQSNYERFDGRPLLLNFGPEYYKGAAWSQLFQGLKTRPYLLSLDSKQGVADGTFGWPQPNKGKWIEAMESYYSRAKGLGLEVAPAFPRFDDFYGDAGTQPSFGKIPDAGGETLQKTLIRALESKSPIIQLITWNDWGEGTVVEPSKEFGYQDLEITQRFIKAHLKPDFRFKADDLRLPVRLYLLRKSHPGNRQYLEISSLLLKGDVAKASRLLTKLEANSG